jgi:hypothetical protein
MDNSNKQKCVVKKHRLEEVGINPRKYDEMDQINFPTVAATNTIIAISTKASSPAIQTTTASFFLPRSQPFSSPTIVLLDDPL